MMPAGILLTATGAMCTAIGFLMRAQPTPSSDGKKKGKKKSKKKGKKGDEPKKPKKGAGLSLIAGGVLITLVGLGFVVAHFVKQS